MFIAIIHLTLKQFINNNLHAFNFNFEMPHNKRFIYYFQASLNPF